jgi:Ca2+-binding RTX toxin-like protein
MPTYVSNAAINSLITQADSTLDPAVQSAIQAFLLDLNGGALPPGGYIGSIEDGTQVSSPSDVIDYTGPGGIITADPGNDLLIIDTQLPPIDLTVYGGNDLTVAIGAGDDTLDLAGTGHVMVYGGAGADLIDDTGAGNDTLFDPSSGFDTLQAGSGDDLLHGFGADTLIGGSGDDTLIGGTAATFVAGSGNETFISGSLAGGGTTIVGSASPTSNDIFWAGAGNDSITGGAGNNTIFGGSGADTLIGGTGTSYVQAGSGVGQFLEGGSGYDTLSDPGGGSDTLMAGSGDDVLFGFGDDTLEGGAGSDTLYAAQGASESMTGGSGNDLFVLQGTSGHDTVEGGAGNNTLWLTAEAPPAGVADNSYLVADGDDGLTMTIGSLTVDIENVQTIVFNDDVDHKLP